MTTTMQVSDRRDFWFCFLDVSVMTDTSLSVYDKAVYAALCSFANPQHRSCYPSLAAIAERAGCSKRRVQESLATLEASEYITRVSRAEERRVSLVTLTGKRLHQAPPEDARAIAPDAIARDAIASGAPTMAHGATGTITTNYIKPTSPSERRDEVAIRPAEASCESRGRVAFDPQELPRVFLETAELFLHKTGRVCLNAEDVEALRELSRNHTPARVQREITTAVDRFRRRGRDPSALTFGYLRDALKNQKTRRDGYKGQEMRPVMAITDEDREEWGIR